MTKFNICFCLHLNLETQPNSSLFFLALIQQASLSLLALGETLSPLFIQACLIISLHIAPVCDKMLGFNMTDYN